MKILLTGASGLLGAAYARSAARRGHYVTGLVGRFAGRVEGVALQRALDLTDLAAVEGFVLEAFPDAIVNCAAVSNPADCERDPAASRRLNVELPEKLALLSRHLFATFIHISSEQVFDGAASPYGNDSPTRPVNEYGRQKVESEERVMALASEFATILRLPLLNGNSPAGVRSIHERLLLAWERGETASLFTDEFRQPCLADNAADLMVELCERQDLKGIHSWAGATRVSRYELGQRILERFGLPADWIRPAARGDDPRFARRQPDLSFDLYSLSGKTKTQPQALEQQLDGLIVPPPRRAWYNAV